MNCSPFDLQVAPAFIQASQNLSAPSKILCLSVPGWQKPLAPGWVSPWPGAARSLPLQVRGGGGLTSTAWRHRAPAQPSWAGSSSLPAAACGSGCRRWSWCRRWDAWSWQRASCRLCLWLRLNLLTPLLLASFCSLQGRRGQAGVWRRGSPPDATPNILGLFLEGRPLKIALTAGCNLRGEAIKGSWGL